MNNELDPNKIAQLLTKSSRQLDDATLSALASARHNALNRQSAKSPAFSFTTGSWTSSMVPHSAQQWVVTGLLMAILIIGAGYIQHSEEQQISDLDVAILTDELPIEVFVD